MGKRARLSSEDLRNLRIAACHARSRHGLLKIQSALKNVSVADITNHDIRYALGKFFDANSLATSFTLSATNIDPEEQFTLRWWHPHKFVECLIVDNNEFENLIDAALTQYPPTMRTPWRILVAWDKMVPGNALTESGRKITV